MPRILARAGILVALLTPALVFAAYNDVTLTTNASFNVGGTVLNVYTSSAVIQSATVNASNMTLTLLPGSSATVSSPGKGAISQSGGSNYITINECDNNASQIGFAYPAGAGSAVTITLSLSGATCAGGSGSGGGGGSIASATLTTIASSTTPAVAPATPVALATNSSGLSDAQIQSIIALLISFGGIDQATINKVTASLHGSGSPRGVSAPPTGKGSFSRNLQAGATNNDVLLLQRYLNAHGFTVAPSGAGSPGHETPNFGLATKAALAKFQKAHNITPASGFFGPLTRAAINSGE